MSEIVLLSVGFALRDGSVARRKNLHKPFTYRDIKAMDYSAKFVVGSYSKDLFYAFQRLSLQFFFTIKQLFSHYIRNRENFQVKLHL